MRFVFKKKVLSSIMAATMAAGFAASQNAAAIHLAEDGIGQVLLAPLYLADYGYRTKFAIVNTRDDVAVKAKVVFRSQLTSVETIDFICYLTPGDVCRFEVANQNGKAVLISSDDSVLNSVNPPSAPVFASQTPVVDRELFKHNLGTGDTNTMGHVEVIGAYGVRGTVRVPANSYSGRAERWVEIRKGMSKQDLFDIFIAPRTPTDLKESETVSITPLSQLNPPETVAIGRMVNGVCSFIPTRDAGVPCNGIPITDDASPGGNIRSADPSWVRLLGYAELVRDDGSDRMGYRIPALAGEIWDNAPIGSGYDGRVISYRDFNVILAKESGLGRNFGGVKYTGVGQNPLETTPYDNIVELEHALATTNIKSSYEDNAKSGGINNTKLLVTFPTKYRHWRNDPCQAGYPAAVDVAAGYKSGEWSAPFQPTGLIGYNLLTYDDQEHNIQTLGFSPWSGGIPVTNSTYLPAEVNYFIPDWPKTGTQNYNFDSGWFNMKIIPKQGCSYSGAPILSFTHKYMTGGTGGIKNSFLTQVGHVPELINRDLAPLPPSPTTGE